MEPAQVACCWWTLGWPAPADDAAATIGDCLAVFWRAKLGWRLYGGLQLGSARHNSILQACHESFSNLRNNRTWHQRFACHILVVRQVCYDAAMRASGYACPLICKMAASQLLRPWSTADNQHYHPALAERRRTSYLCSIDVHLFGVILSNANCCCPGLCHANLSLHKYINVSAPE